MPTKIEIWIHVDQPRHGRVQPRRTRYTVEEALRVWPRPAIIQALREALTKAKET